MFESSGKKNWDLVGRRRTMEGRAGVSMHRARGVTLIELLTVVVIVAILASVAIPAYKSSVMKSNRSTAKAALLDLAGREEKYYSVANTYAFNPNDTALPTIGTQLYGSNSTVTFPINVPGTGPTLYTIAAPTVVAAVAATGTTAGTPATFSISAVPVGSQASDSCGTFTINSVGQQTVSGTASSCW